MASFELIGYVKGMSHLRNCSRVTIGEYVQGKRKDDGTIDGEKMDLWQVFFPISSRRHLYYFKTGDMVIVKGTIHQASPGSEYVYAINAETIKHFYTRNLMGEQKLLKVSKDSLGDEVPDPTNDYSNDF